jgi:mycothiol synthase
VVTPTEFVPESASSEDWRRYHDFRRRSQAEWRPDEPPEPDPVAQALMLLPSKRNWTRRWQVVVDEEMVSELGATAPKPESPEYETNRHIIWSWAWTLQPHRRRGIGRALIPTVLQVMEEYGATVLEMGSDQEDGHAFLRWLGAEPRLRERESRLDLRQIDWGMVEGWVRSGQAASPEAKLELYSDRMPESMLDEYSRVRSDLLNTVPWEELDHGKIVDNAAKQLEFYQRLEVSESAHHVCLVRDADGSIVGMTDVVQHPYEPEFVRQYFTGVHPNARGRGIGKWIKAAMLLHVRRRHPEAVTVATGNARSNDAMLAINYGLGFRPFRDETFYQIGLDRLRSSAD